MSGPDLAIIFLIFLIAFSLDLALWRSILMVKQFSGARETSRKEADISTFSKYFILKRQSQRFTVNFLHLVNLNTPDLKYFSPLYNILFNENTWSVQSSCVCGVQVHLEVTVTYSQYGWKIWQGPTFAVSPGLCWGSSHLPQSPSVRLQPCSRFTLGLGSLIKEGFCFCNITSLE